MFRGSAEVNMDEKGRLALPKPFRSQLAAAGETELVITLDASQRCLLLYPLSEWDSLEKKLKVLPDFQPQSKRIKWLILGHCSDIKLDGAGRFLVPKKLREYAELVKQVVFLNQANRLEIWDEKHYLAMCELRYAASIDGEAMSDEASNFTL